MWESDIFKDNIEEGNLDIEPSYVKVDSIYTVEKSIVRKVAARLNEEKIMEIKKLISKLFSLTLF